MYKCHFNFITFAAGKFFISIFSQLETKLQQALHRPPPPARAHDRGMEGVQNRHERTKTAPRDSSSSRQSSSVANTMMLPHGDSADILLTEEECLLQRADALLARGGVDQSEHVPTHVTYEYTKRASSVSERRGLVRRYLMHKWSIKSREAAVIKTNSRPIVVRSPFDDEDDLKRTAVTRNGSRLRRYSGWCAVCQIHREWCGFEHVDPGRRVLQPISSSYKECKPIAKDEWTNDVDSALGDHRSKKLSEKGKKKILRFVGEDGMTEFEARVKRKAMLRRGKSKQNEAWLAGTKQRSSTQIFNQHRIMGLMQKAGEMESVQDWLKMYYYDSEEDMDDVDEKDANKDAKETEPASNMESRAEKVYKKMTDGGTKLAEWKEAWQACEQRERNGGVWTPNRFVVSMISVAQGVAGFTLSESLARDIYAHLDVTGSKLLESEVVVRAVEDAVVNDGQDDDEEEEVDQEEEVELGEDED